MFSASDPLYRANGIVPERIASQVIYDSTDATKTGTDLSVVAGVDGGSYPEIRSTTTDLSVFKAGEYVITSGFSDGANNGVFRVVESDARSLSLSGAGASAMVTAAAGSSVTIRRLRVVALADLGHEAPFTLTASSTTNLSGAVLQHSPDGKVWVPSPDIALPDSEADNAATINAHMGRSLLVRMASVPSNFSGTIWVS